MVEKEQNSMTTKRQKDKSIFKKSAPVWAILVVVILCSSGVAALVIYSVGVERISIWGGEIQDSRFSITELTTKIKGPNRVDISIVIRNDDTSPRSATVAVNLLYENGDPIIDAARTVENLNGGDSLVVDYEFRQVGLTIAYDRSFIVITDID